MCATYLETLVIHNCPNFSIAGLRRLVQSRLGINGNEWYPSTMRIRAIEFSGNVPWVSHADRVWFRGNWVTFYQKSQSRFPVRHVISYPCSGPLSESHWPAAMTLTRSQGLLAISTRRTSVHRSQVTHSSSSPPFETCDHKT
jgi:hypothetical protein